MTIKMKEGDCGGISVIASGSAPPPHRSGSASKVKTKIEAAFSPS